MKIKIEILTILFGMAVLCRGYANNLIENQPLKPVLTFDTTAQNVQYEPATGNYRVYYDDYKGIGKFWIFKPANKILMYVNAKCTPVAGTKKYKYVYEISNGKNSKQNIWSFAIEYKKSLTNIISPENWHYGYFSYKSVIDWNGELSAGKSIKGFSFESEVIPGIVECYGDGYTEPHVFSNYESEIAEDTRPPLPDFFGNCVVGKTIGPDIIPLPPVITPISLIKRLITLKEESFKLGWIDNRGIANSLNKKLENTKDAVNRGQNETAKNILNAFINEVESQRGKHINDNAYYLLKTNAEFIVSKL